MAWWPVALAVTAWILLAAKAHGRQVRLEREQQGVFSVDFEGENPEAVKAIWAIDRRNFWFAFVGLGLFLTVGRLLREDWVAAGFSVPIAFAMGFMFAGTKSWLRLAGRKQGPLAWRRRAMLGSWLWWGAAIATMVLTLVLWVLA